MELITLALFCAGLLICVLFNFSILYALAFGMVIFSLYALLTGCSFKQLLHMILSGISEAKNVLFALLLVGILTAVWRACGTIAGIICYTEPLIGNKTFVLMSFLLCCLVSYLTGTAFGTAGTMGVICMTMGLTKGFPPMYLGGAILSGCYFGDRCSPVSTSVLLVSELTGTDVFQNLKRFFLDALVPFFIACALFLLLGLFSDAGGEKLDLEELFSRELKINLWTLVPALVMIIFSLMKMNVRITMSASIVAAILICIFVQHIDGKVLLKLAVLGYKAQDTDVAVLLNGGGIISMIKVIAIIGLSSGFAGIFDKTELLTGVHNLLDRMSKKVSVFGGLLITAIFSGMLACNQTLGIILSEQLYGHIYKDNEKDLALGLANSIVLIAPLIPWTTACAAPMASIGAPKASILLAFYLYIAPIYYLTKCKIKAKSQIA